MRISKSAKLGLLIIISCIMTIESIKSNSTFSNQIPHENTIGLFTTASNSTAIAQSTRINQTSFSNDIATMVLCNFENNINDVNGHAATTVGTGLTYNSTSPFSDRYSFNLPTTAASQGAEWRTYLPTGNAPTCFTAEVSWTPYASALDKAAAYVIAADDSNGNGGGSVFQIGLTATNGYLQAQVLDQNGWAACTSTLVPVAGSWYNLMFIWEMPYLRLYNNGTLIASGITTTGQGLRSGQAGLYYICAGYTASWVKACAGMYDNFRFSNISRAPVRPLSQVINTSLQIPNVQVNQIINATVGCSYSSSTSIPVVSTDFLNTVNNSYVNQTGQIVTAATTYFQNFNIAQNAQDYFFQNGSSVQFTLGFQFCNWVTMTVLTINSWNISIQYYTLNPALYNNIELINSASTPIDFRFNSSDFIVGPGTTFWNLTQGYYNFTMLPATLQGSTYVIGAQLQASVWVYINGITVQVFGYQPTSYVSCSIGVKNQQNNHIENQIAQYLVNGTSVNPVSFTRAVGSINNITLIDNFGNNIATTWFAVNTIDNTNNNYFEFTINQYTLSVYNQQSSFNLVNVTQSGSFNLTKYLGPNTQWDFNLFTGTYYVWVNNSETATWIRYTYTINSNTNLLISSANNTLSNILNNIQLNGASITNISLWLNTTITGTLQTSIAILQQQVVDCNASIIAMVNEINNTISWLLNNQTQLITTDYQSTYQLLTLMNATIFDMNNTLFFFNGTTQTSLLLDIQSLAQMINQTTINQTLIPPHNWMWVQNQINPLILTIDQGSQGKLFFHWNINNQLLTTNSSAANARIQLDRIDHLDMAVNVADNIFSNDTSFYIQNSGQPLVNFQNGLGFQSAFDCPYLLYSNYNEMVVNGPPLWLNYTMGFVSGYDPTHLRVSLPFDRFLSFYPYLDTSQFSANTPTFNYEIFDGTSANHITNTVSLNLPILYSLYPIFYLNSSYMWNDLDFYIYTPSTMIDLGGGSIVKVFDWVLMNPQNVLLANPYYMIRLIDKQTKAIIFQDTSMQNFTVSRTLDIPTLKIRNNAIYPIIFTMTGSQSMQFQIDPYSSAMNNYIYSSNCNYDIRDIYGNLLANGVVQPNQTLIAFTPSNTICQFTIHDQHGNILDLSKFHITITATVLNQTTTSFLLNVYGQFYADVGTNVTIVVRDYFNNLAATQIYIVDATIPFMDMTLNIYSIQIYNQCQNFTYVNMTMIPTTAASWTEWLMPASGWNFELLPNTYLIQITNYETNNVTSYIYHLAGDDILFIQSNSTLVNLLGSLGNLTAIDPNLIAIATNCLFGSHLTWTNNLAYMQSQIGNYSFINQYSGDTVRVELRWNNSDVYGFGLAAQNNYNTIMINTNVSYRALFQNGTLIRDWTPVTNKTVVIGYYSSAINVETFGQTNLNDVLFVIIFVAGLVFIVTYITVKAKRVPDKKIAQKEKTPKASKSMSKML